MTQIVRSLTTLFDTRLESPPVVLQLMVMGSDLFAAMPLLLYHLWKLIDAWLPASKRRVALPFIAASVGLFYIGVAFAFFLVLPNVFKFFATRELTGVTVTPDINAFLSFTLGMVFAFGLAFQVPIIVIIIAWTGLVSRKALKSARPYVFLAVFVIAAVLTPPDVFSQTLLAVPMYVLYEIALLACARFLPDRD